jgi:predicted neutral ceramidase superfamily lipid hydrolase
MLNEQEIEFLHYWEQNRERENTFTRKLTGGLPMALLFSMPIVLSVLVVRLFLPEWYTKISNTTPGTFITIIFAMIVVALFYSFFRMQYKWEMNEQLYKELKAKERSIKNQKS